MKTISKKSAENKLSKLVSEKKITKNSKIYGWALQLIEGETDFRPVYSMGSSWKHSSLFDKTNEFSLILKLMKIEYILGNDAPRGGKTGVFIKITTKVK